MDASVASSEARAAARKGAPRVLLDTNILLLPFERNFPLELELARWTTRDRILVPSAVLGELGRLIARGKRAAVPAKELAIRFRIARSRTPGDVGIIEQAVRLRAWVATSDRALRASLGSAGVTVLQPRGESRLELARRKSMSPLRRSPSRAGRPRTSRSG